MKTALRRRAEELGFLAVGISSAERLSSEEVRLAEWLGLGFHGSMKWMENHRDKRVDPAELVPGAKSVISILENYYWPEAHSENPNVGKISRYAWGDDYHLIFREKLNALLSWMSAEFDASGRAFVDSAPVMDKAWAVRSGIGWLGKHSNVINPSFGSWFFIGELIVDVELEPDSPIPDMCGSCTRCIDACPTDAIVQPYVVDSRKCISYATIENRDDEIAADISEDLGSWIFGCDICQDVCPWNKFREPTTDSRYAPRPGSLETTFEAWGRLDETSFRERFAGSAVKRSKWTGFKRNVRAAKENASPGGDSASDPRSTEVQS